MFHCMFHCIFHRMVKGLPISELAEAAKLPVCHPNMPPQDSSPHHLKENLKFHLHPGKLRLYYPLADSNMLAYMIDAQWADSLFNGSPAEDRVLFFTKSSTHFFT